MSLENKMNGLILSGGKSTRMGTDKGQLRYRGMPHRDYLYNLVNDFCERTFLSVRQTQKETLDPEKNFILDNNEYRGPFNGILSAHQRYQDAAWMVFACDLPFLNTETVKLLAECRNTEKKATVFATKESGLPEPLCAIWEPKGLIEAKEWLKTSGTSCPRKFLMNTEIELVFPKDDEVLFNANSQADYEKAMNRM